MDNTGRRSPAGHVRLSQAMLDDMAKAGRPKLGKSPTTLYNFKVDAARLARWQTAADKAGVKLSEWLRDAADAKLKKARKR